jgi:hypothetical protein
MDEFVLSYDSQENSGLFTKDNANNSSAWQRLSSAAMILEPSSTLHINQIKLPWYQALSLLREFMPLQRQLKFRFVTDGSSKTLVERFVEEQRATRAARSGAVQITITEEELLERLRLIGFSKRDLRFFQIRDILRLISLPNGANFSVPGAGKTTVTLAVHLLTTDENDKLLVICPKAAFSAWSEIIEQCIQENNGWPYDSTFINLSGQDDRSILQLLSSGNRFFFTNYEHFAARKETFSYLISTRSVHLVLDESHRMKAGELSQRGAALLSIANLPKRKDILSGTPMPQGPSDLQSQLDFLWPGSSLGLRIQRGERPNDVISGLYTRTTKIELGLPPVQRHFIQVPMTSAQAALYGVVKSEVLRQLSSFRAGQGLDIIKARKSVMRLLQLCSNPLLAIRSISEDVFFNEYPLINAILNDPISSKMQEACRLVRANASQNRKTVLWTIFTKNITDLEQLLADLNPLSIYGEVKSGDVEDPATREGRLRRFHIDDACMVLIANPAAAGEGISLHEVCHEAIYLDRSYVSTHYLQSIDRIHRLGLLPGTVTNITILQSSPPSGLGSIDYSVSRRLSRKIRSLQQLLDDPDLHLVALDEETADEPIDYSMDIDDVADLIEELEGNIPYNPNDGI